MHEYRAPQPPVTHKPTPAEALLLTMFTSLMNAYAIELGINSGDKSAELNKCKQAGTELGELWFGDKGDA